MTQEEFVKRMNDYKSLYDFPESFMIRGAMGFTARMCLAYPELAKVWYDSLPKATQD